MLPTDGVYKAPRTTESTSLVIDSSHCSTPPPNPPSLSYQTNYIQIHQSDTASPQSIHSQADSMCLKQILEFDYCEHPQETLITCPSGCTRPQVKKYFAQCCCSKECCDFWFNLLDSTRTPIKTLDSKIIDAEGRLMDPGEKTRRLFDIALKAAKQEQLEQEEQKDLEAERTSHEQCESIRMQAMEDMKADRDRVSAS